MKAFEDMNGRELRDLVRESRVLVNRASPDGTLVHSIPFAMVTLVRGGWYAWDVPLAARAMMPGLGSLRIAGFPGVSGGAEVDG